MRSQGLGASAPQPVGASGQLGKVQALPCAENLFSRCGVRLCEYDGTPHGRACPSSAELPEFLQRQECGTAETVSEAPVAYGIRSCSHAARVASYETTSALTTLPSPEVGMAPRYTLSEHHPAVSPSFSPWKDLAFLRAGELLEQVSRHTVVTTDTSSTGWGATCNWQAASGLWTGPRLLWHINCLELWTVHLAFMAVQATAVGQARPSPHGQHSGCLVYQPVGRYTITPHVTARPPSPPLSDMQFKSLCAVHIPEQLNRAADALSLQLTFPGEWRLHPEMNRLIWSRFGEAQVNLFSSHKSSHCQLYFFSPWHGRTGTQLASGFTQVCASHSEPTRTDTVQAQGG